MYKNTRILWFLRVTMAAAFGAAMPLNAQPSPAPITQAVQLFGGGVDTAHLSGGSLQALSGNTGFVAENSAVLESLAFRLTADKISVEYNPHVVVATGHVRVAEHDMHDFVTLGDRAVINPDDGVLTVTGRPSAEYADGEPMGHGDTVIVNLGRREMEMTGHVHSARDQEPLHVNYTGESGQHPSDMQVMESYRADELAINIRMVNFVSPMPAQIASIPPAASGAGGSANTAPVKFLFWIPSSLAANATTRGQSRRPLNYSFSGDEGEADPPSPDDRMVNFTTSIPAPISISANRDVQLGLSTKFNVYPEGQPRLNDPNMPEMEIINVPKESDNGGTSSYTYLSPLPVDRSQTAASPTDRLPKLKPETKYVVEAVQTIFATPDPTGAGRKAAENGGGMIMSGNNIFPMGGISSQLSNGPRQTLWSRTLVTNFTTGPAPNPRVPWPPPLPAVATAPDHTIYPAAVASSPTLQVYQARNSGFQFEAPKDWKINETDYGSGGADWMLTVNNQRADLQVLGISKPAETAFTRTHPGESLGPAMVLVAEKGPLAETHNSLRQMLPGEISLAIGRRYDQASYPGGALAWGSEMSPDNLDHDLHPLLADDLIKSLDEAELSGLDLRFVKRGMGYEIACFMRAPISPEDRQRVLDLLASFHFVDAPVSNPQWAIFLARPHLPVDLLAKIKMNPTTRWTSPSDGLRFATHTKKTATGYLVTFTQTKTIPKPHPMLYGGPPPPGWDPRPDIVPMAAWEFFVKASGEVVPIEDAATTSPDGSAVTQVP